MDRASLVSFKSPSSPQNRQLALSSSSKSPSLEKLRSRQSYLRRHNGDSPHGDLKGHEGIQVIFYFFWILSRPGFNFSAEQSTYKTELFPPRCFKYCGDIILPLPRANVGSITPAGEDSVSVLEITNTHRHQQNKMDHEEKEE